MTVQLERELGLIRKHLDRRLSITSEGLWWFEFIPVGEGSVYDDVYDEGIIDGGGRTYKTGTFIPTIFVEEYEDEARAIETGRQPTQNVRATFAYHDLVNSGVTNPTDYQPRLNDMFMYDDRFYNVYRYAVKGRLHGQSNTEVLVAVEGVQSYPGQELVLDVAPSVPPAPQWPTTLP